MNIQFPFQPNFVQKAVLHWLTSEQWLPQLIVYIVRKYF